MRILRIAVVATTILVMAGPADAATWPAISEWGPGGTLNGATSPTYALPITVLDSIRVTVPAGERRQAWTRLRNEALAEWGLPFVVVNAPDLPVTDPGWAPPAGTIALVRSQNYLDASLVQGAYLADYGSGIVLLGVDSHWLQWQGLWRSYISHEVGHALGFGHPYSDDQLRLADFNCPVRWVMGCAYHVSTEERLFAQAYYGVA